MSHVASGLLGILYRFFGPKLLYPLAMNQFAYWLFQIFIVRGRKTIRFTTKYGFFMELSPYEYYMSGYFFLGESNPMETRVLRRVLRIGDIFLDVGAHIGWYSLSARQIVGPAGKVIAFEPNPSCVSELKQNIILNSLHSIKIEKIAIADKNKKSDFWLGDDMAGSLIKESAQELTHYSVKKILVTVKTLDTYCREHKIENIRLLKIDVEGAEEKVIQGAMRMLRKYHPCLILEIYSDTLKSRRTRMKMLRSLMKIGYKLYVFTSGGIEQVTINNLSLHIINVFMSVENI